MTAKAFLVGIGTDKHHSCGGSLSVKIPLHAPAVMTHLGGVATNTRAISICVLGERVAAEFAGILAQT